MDKDIIKKALKSTSIKALKAKLNKIEYNVENLSEVELERELNDLLALDYKGEKACVYYTHLRNYAEKTVFYRARKINQETLDKLSINDFWEPPENLIQFGRLNKPQQQLLYISPDEPITPTHEARIKNNDFFLLTRYESTEPIVVKGIGFSESSSSSSSNSTKSNKKLDLITDCINRLFLRTGKLSYQISCHIAHNMLGIEGYDGWVYPSIMKPGGENICLKISSKKKLKIHSAAIGTIHNDEYKIHYSILINGGNIKFFNDFNTDNSTAKAVLDSWSQSEGELGGPKTLDDTKYEIGFIKND